MAKKWYTIQAYSNYENKVRLSLEERIKREGMEDKFGEILIPKEKVEETRDGKKRVSQRTFYPGYIFVEMELTDETWHLVNGTPKVSGFLGGRTPTEVPLREIHVITQQMEDGAAKPKPAVHFQPGDHVRVIEGPFANFNGIVESFDLVSGLLKLNVSIFGRNTPVEISYTQVERIV